MVGWIVRLGSCQVARRIDPVEDQDALAELTGVQMPDVVGFGKAHSLIA
jgi:hypothetical protein